MSTFIDRLPPHLLAIKIIQRYVDRFWTMYCGYRLFMQAVFMLYSCFTYVMCISVPLMLVSDVLVLLDLHNGSKRSYNFCTQC
jgi:hypothetical protein